MNFNGATKVKQIAVADPRARQILEESGVDYCCGGDKSLHEACMHADVSAEEILSRLRKNTESAGSPCLKMFRFLSVSAMVFP